MRSARENAPMGNGPFANDSFWGDRKRGISILYTEVLNGTYLEQQFWVSTLLS
jgi:hypothetical protein